MASNITRLMKSSNARCTWRMPLFWELALLSTEVHQILHGQLVDFEVESKQACERKANK
jgi:hypothetical protein